MSKRDHKIDTNCETSPDNWVRWHSLVIEMIHHLTTDWDGTHLWSRWYITWQLIEMALTCDRDDTSPDNWLRWHSLVIEMIHHLTTDWDGTHLWSRWYITWQLIEMALTCDRDDTSPDNWLRWHSLVIEMIHHLTTDWDGTHLWSRWYITWQLIEMALTCDWDDTEVSVQLIVFVTMEQFCPDCHVRCNPSTIHHCTHSLRPHKIWHAVKSTYWKAEGQYCLD